MGGADMRLTTYATITLACVAIMSGFSASQATAQVTYATPTGWRERVEQEFGFSVELPVEAQRTEELSGIPNLFIEFRDQAGQIVVVVMDFKRVGATLNVPPKAMLQGMADDVATEQGLELLSKKELVIDGGEGLEANYRSASLNIGTRVRFIWANGRLYTFTGVGLADGHLPPGYERVLGSFKLSAPPPPGPGSR